MNIIHQQQYPFITEPPNYSQPGPSRLGHYQPTYFETVRARATPLAPAPQFVESYQPVEHCNMTAAVVGPAVANHPWQSAWNNKATAPAPPLEPAISQSSSSSSSRFDQLLRAKLAAEQSQRHSMQQAITVPSSFDASLAKLQSADIPANAFFAAQAQAQQQVDVKPDLAALQAVVTPCPQSGYQYQPVQDRKPSGQSDTSAQTASEFMTRVGSGSMPGPVGDMYAAHAPNAQVNSGLQVPEGTQYWSSAPSTPNSATPGLPSPYEQAVLVKYGVIPPPAPASNPVTPVYNKYSSETEWSQPSEPAHSHRGSFDDAQPVQQTTFVYKVSPVFHGRVSASGPPSLASSVESQTAISPITPMMSTYAPPVPVDVKPLISPLLPAAPLHSDDYHPHPYGPGMYPMHAGIHGQAHYTTMSADGQGGLPSGNGLYDSGSHGSDGLGGGGLDGSNLPNGLDFSYGGGGDGNGGNGEGGNGDQPHQMPTKPKKLPLACHFCRRRKLKCDGIKPTCDNCNKRNVECSYDEAPRRRGPGKRTKEMRDRAAREAQALGMVNNNSVQSGDVDPSQGDIHQQHHQHQHQLHHQQLDLGVEHHHQHHHHDHSDLILDPALADENGSGAFTDAMGALKRAGIDIGSLDDGDLGEPSTLAEISELHAAAASAEAEAAADESAVVEGIKRKAEIDLENNKRIRLDGEGHDGQGGEEISVIPGLDDVQVQQVVQGHEGQE